MKGVLDRIEDGIAVILVEDRNAQFTVLEQDLPPGSKEGTWFALEFDGSHYHIKHIDKHTTSEKKERATDLLQQLKLRKKQSKFERK